LSVPRSTYEPRKLRGKWANDPERKAAATFTWATQLLVDGTKLGELPFLHRSIHSQDSFDVRIMALRKPNNQVMSIEAIIFYVLLIDAIGANIIVRARRDWYVHRFRTISRWFPPAEGWVLYYLILVLWIGSLLYRAGKLF
jgi:hypothetical protein